MPHGALCEDDDDDDDDVMTVHYGRSLCTCNIIAS